MSCDRGQCYCGERCAAEARRESLREANRRYQSRPEGARNNAARQKRHRTRQAIRELLATVTDHGSGGPPETREPSGAAAMVSPQPTEEVLDDRQTARVAVDTGDIAEERTADSAADTARDTEDPTSDRHRCRFCGAFCGDVIWQRADWPGSLVRLRRFRRRPG